MSQLETFRRGEYHFTGAEHVERMQDILCTPGEYVRTGMESENDLSLVPYKFGRYIVEVRLDAQGKFLGINGISIAEDFLSLAQRLASIGYIDTDKEYPPD